jgi:hypothetical protein
MTIERRTFCIDVSLHNGGKLALTSGIALNINMDSSADVKNKHRNETENKQTKVSCVNKLIEFWYDNVLYTIIFSGQNIINTRS